MEPERRVLVDPDTATASCASSLAYLAVAGGLHVGWKSSSTGSSSVTWQVRFCARVLSFIIMTSYNERPTSFQWDVLKAMFRGKRWGLLVRSWS